jgi:DMSO/TMAO reductase YedYZ molybdopterin-dependent catalytic subunit
MEVYDMKKKLIFSVILTVVALGGFAGLVLTIRSTGTGQDKRVLKSFEPESIDIDRIDSDLEFAQALPEYRIMVDGLVRKSWSATLVEIIKKAADNVETFDADGIRSDGKKVNLSFTGIKLSVLLGEVEPLPGTKNIAIYGNDLYATVIPYDELAKENLYLVWKKEGKYMVPSEDGVLKLVADGGLTKNWVKNPVRFDFIGDFNNEVPLADRIDIDMLDFISQQSLFTLAIGRVPNVDIEEYTLRIKGLVTEPAALTYDMIVSLEQASVYATLETISNPPGGRSIGNAIWTGVPFSSLLDLVSPDEAAQEVVFYCLDGYSTSITLEESKKNGVLLAYKVNGEFITPRHGYPVRLVVPGKYGMKWPKWIHEIELVDYDYKGYWEKRGWSDYAGRDRPDLRYD